MKKKLNTILKSHFEEFIDINEFQHWQTSPVFKAGDVTITLAWLREKAPETRSQKDLRRWENGGRNAYIKALSRKLVAYNGGEYARRILHIFLVEGF